MAGEPTEPSCGPRGRRRAGTARLAVAGLCLAAAGCDDLRVPRDPEGTLDRVRAERLMTVAAAENPPFVEVAGEGPPTGAEVDLVEAFARDLGVGVRWRILPAFAALDALEEGDADLAIGGFSEADVTAHGKGAPTYAYLETRLLVAGPPTVEPPVELDGVRVQVPADDVAARLVEDEGGRPVVGPEPGVFSVLADWRLPGSGLASTGVELRRDRHVLAVPQGENAWLLRLERFLRVASAGTAAALREHDGR